MDDRGESRGADVFDFVDEFLSDRERGRDHPLAHYLARYPRCQDEIAREYLALKAPSDAGPRSKVPVGTERTPAAVEQRVGPYRILSAIGRGGQGAVFLAEDTRIARRVALKVLASSFDLVSEERRRRFRREAEVVARLEHPGICRVYEADIDGETPYIAMGYVEGRSLAQVHADARSSPSGTSSPGPGGEPIAWPARSAPDVRRVLLLFERVARALHAAHEAGVVHRDVKPGNVMIAGDGQPVLLDFGLARDEQAGLATLTQSGDVFGTPAYMSPEQLVGGTPLDRRTDVYSLAVALYESLTLELPFEAPTRLELCRKILEQPIPDPREKNPALSEDVKVVLETALERDRARRYATALDLAEDLRRIREYEPIRARPASVALRLSRWTRRHPVLAVSIAGTILSLSGGLGMALHLLGKADSALEIALGQHLARRCVELIPEDPALALAVGIEAADREIRQTGAEQGASYLTRAALFQALDACWLERVLSGEPARLVADAAVSPDGRHLALAADDDDPSRPPVQVARVFELATGRVLFALQGSTGRIRRILYLPDGARIATVESVVLEREGRETEARGVVHVFDARTGALEREIDAGEPLVDAVLDRDGTSLATIDRTGRAAVWEPRSGAHVCDLDLGAGGIVAAAFDRSTEGRLLTRASAAHPKASTATIWDVWTGRAVADLAAGTQPITASAVGPAGGLVALGCQDGTLRLFDSRDGDRIGESVTLGARVGFVCFSPDGSRLLAATDRGEEGEAVLVELATLQVRPLRGHEGRRVVHGAFSPDGSLVATASHDRTVRVWDAATAEELRVLKSRTLPFAVTWSPDGARLVTVHNDRFVNVWFARNRPDVFDLVGHEARVVRAVFSPDDRTALTASEDGTARIWSIPPQRPDPKDVELEPGSLLHVLRHEGPLHDARFSEDGSRVVTASEDGTARVWSPETGETLVPPLVHPAAVLSGALDRDGSRVLTVCADGKARLFLLGSDEPPLVLESPSGSVLCATFDPAGRTIAGGTSGESIGIWDAATGEPIRELRYHGREPGAAGVDAVAFAPRSALLAAACRDKVVRFFEPRTWASARPDQLLAARGLSFSSDGSRLLVTGRFGGGAATVMHLDEDRAPVPATVAHRASVTGGVLSADGRHALTFARDGTAHVWEASTGRPVAYRSGNGAGIVDASFDHGAGGARVITACEDGSVSVWPVDPLPAARARRPRGLHPHERDRERRLALPLRFD